MMSVNRILNHPEHTFDTYYTSPITLPPLQKQRAPMLDIVNLLCQNDKEETPSPSLSVTSSPTSSEFSFPLASSLSTSSNYSTHSQHNQSNNSSYSSIPSLSSSSLHQPYHPLPYNTQQHKNNQNSINHHQYQHRLFLMMNDEEEDYYHHRRTSGWTDSTDSDSDDHDPRIKSKRRRASNKQLQVLNRVFQHTFFPSTQVRAQLGRQLGMSPRTVQIWFQNRRQAIRTKERRRGNNLV